MLIMKPNFIMDLPKLKSFKYEKYKYETELSKYIWDLHEQNKSFPLCGALQK